MKRYVTFGALVGVVLIVILAARSSERAGAAPRPDADTTAVAVLGASDVAQATRLDLIAGVPISGSLDPAIDVRIAAPVPEVLEDVLVKEGQAVRQGQILARFRTSATEPAALSAEAQRRLAASDYERMQNLFKEGAVAQRDVENAEVTLRAAQAAEAQARKRLDEAIVRAPVPGVIAARLVDAGDRVKDGDQLFRLVNVSQLELTAAVPSEYATSVHAGDAVVLAVTGTTGATVGGRVARVNATTDAATRQVQVYVTVPNGDRRLVGGLFASGRLILHRVHGAVAVPQPAVHVDSTGGKPAAYVLTVAGGRIVRRDVTTGTVDEQASLVEIVTGLSGGERVIVGPIQGLAPGQRVSLAGVED